MRDAVAHLARADHADLLDHSHLVISPERRAHRAPCPSLITPAESRLTRLFKLSLLSELTERFGKFGNRLVEIRDQTVIGDLENRRIFVLVDRDDHLGILHAGEMLDRA